MLVPFAVCNIARATPTKVHCDLCTHLAAAHYRICVLQRYIGRLRQLLGSAGSAASAAGQEIEALIVMRVRI